VGAFIQQAVQNVPCERHVQGANASISVATYAHPFLNELDPDRSAWELDTSTKARIVGALGSKVVSRPRFLEGCTTGNCTFESLNGVTHITSGFCSRCFETTNALVAEENIMKHNEAVSISYQQVVRLPSSPSLLLARDRNLGMTVNSDDDPFTTFSRSIIGNFTVAINVASISQAACAPGYNCSGLWPPPSRGDYRSWADRNTVSVACGLYPCARHMKAESSNGQFTETVLREELYNGERVSFIGNPTLRSVEHSFIPPCWENNTRYDQQPNKDPLLIDQDLHIVHLPVCAYGVSSPFFNLLRMFVLSLANGNCTTFAVDKLHCGSQNDGLGKSFCRDDPASPPCRTDFWWLQNLYNSGNATFASINEVMENVALAITDSVRMQPYPGVHRVPGTIWESTVCTEFNWPWMCFPAALIILTAIALGSTMSTSARKDGPPIWKSSILPLVYGQVDGIDSTACRDSVNEMERSAKQDILKLEKNDERWRFRLTKKDEGSEVENP
jgi:hypothetical protein